MNLVCRQFAFDSLSYKAGLDLRLEILRRPLGLSWTEADLRGEESSLHMGAFAEDHLVAVLILVPLESDTIKMRQVAVAAEVQGRGVGAQLVRFAEDVARSAGFRWMTAHARETAVSFYERLGYSVEGERFIEVSIPHFVIRKELFNPNLKVE